MNRRLLLLALAVLSLTAVLFLWDLPREHRQKEEKHESELLGFLDPALVDTLRLHQGPELVTVVRDERGWRMITPVTEEANASGVEGMIASFCRATAMRVVAADVDTTALDAFGLGGLRPAEWWVEMISPGRPPLVYYFGRSSPTGKAHYLRVGGSREVQLVSNSLDEISKVSYKALRIYDLFTFQPDEIDSFAVDRGDIHYRAVKNADGLWFTTESPPRQLKRRGLFTIAYDLCEAHIQYFIADGVNEKVFDSYGLGHPRIDIHFRAGQKRHRLRMGGDAGNDLIFARRDEESSLFSINSRLLDSTSKTLEELIETNPAPFNYALLDSVKVVWYTGETITAVPQGPRREWDLRPPAGYQGSKGFFPVAARNLIYGVEELQSDGSVELSSRDELEKYLKVRKVRCELFWPGKTVRYQIGWRGGEDANWLHILGEKRVYRIPRDLFFRMRGTLLAAKLINPHS